ncbi:MAG: aminoacyl-tRNA hydrolase [Puniceicoccales bacterium]|jgi:PTH1 family peptidyl-tRNA hydrolase|nr:aminoacyl-tRNA hydrolase [Puniceicoccales bacterium]
MFFKVVVGLGNHGALYENTRHNVGFATIDYFAKMLGYTTWKHEKGMSVFSIKIPQTDGNLLFIKSDGFMNLTGIPVAKICSFYKIPSNEMVVICDDISLDVGHIKITERVGTAGHNGVRSILEKIGPGFVRFRIGIGKKQHPEMDLADHVLSKFSTEELETLAKKMPNICDNLKLLLDKGVSSTINNANRRICIQNHTEQL